MDAENERMMYQVAGNNNPWGGSDRGYRAYLRYENKKEKLKADRELRDTVKKIKANGL
jgi:hypothetical protein